MPLEGCIGNLRCGALSLVVGNGQPVYSCYRAKWLNGPNGNALV